MKKSDTLSGVILIILSSLFYASYGIWATLIGNFVAGYTASTIRSIMVLLILLPIAHFAKKLDPLDLKINGKKIILMIITSTLIWGLLYYSVINAGIGVSSTINYAAIVIGMVFFGWLLANETLTKIKMISLGLSIFGLSLIFVQTSSGSIHFLAAIAALVSGLAVAANTIIAKQLPYNSTQATCVLWATSVIANLPMIFILGEPLPRFEPDINWIYFLIWSICSILASWMLLNGLKHIDAGFAGILGLLEIVFAILFGIILFKESIEVLTIIGVGVIIFAASYPYMQKFLTKKT